MVREKTGDFLGDSEETFSETLRRASGAIELGLSYDIG